MNDEIVLDELTNDLIYDLADAQGYDRKQVAITALCNQIKKLIVVAKLEQLEYLLPNDQ